MTSRGITVVLLIIPESPPVKKLSNSFGIYDKVSFCIEINFKSNNKLTSRIIFFF